MHKFLPFLVGSCLLMVSNPYLFFSVPSPISEHAIVADLDDKNAIPALHLEQLNVDFHGVKIALEYDPAMLITFPVQITEAGLQQGYERVRQLPHTPFLANISQVATDLELNDWLFHQLLQKALTSLYGTNADTKVTFHTYHLLAAAGYDVRLTYRHKNIYINAYTQEILYEISLIREGNRQYANLNNVGNVNRQGEALYLLNNVPTPGGKAFSFKMKTWPKFPVQQKSRTLSFVADGQTKELTVQYDGALAELMSNYPLVDEHWYLDAPASALLKASILPQFEAILANKSTRRSLETLARFTRSAFEYKEDKTYFGKSKPMIPDELFHYPFSDCEDRSALFYYLVKELLQLPMIVIAYEDHLSIAVAADISGAGINYQGKRYVFCDPTGPSNSSEIGVTPDGYERKEFDIIGSYP